MNLLGLIFRIMEDYPNFMKNERNAVHPEDQTPGAEGYIFDGMEGSQMIIWTSESGVPIRTKRHTHDYEEWFLIILNFGHEAQSVVLELNLAYPGPFTAADALGGEAWPDVPAGEPYPVTLEPASGVVLALTP